MTFFLPKIKDYIVISSLIHLINNDSKFNEVEIVVVELSKLNFNDDFDVVRHENFFNQEDEFVVVDVVVDIVVDAVVDVIVDVVVVGVGVKVETFEKSLSLNNNAFVSFINKF